MTFTTFAMHSFADVADNAGTASNADPSIPETGTEPAESEQGKGSSVNADDAISYYNLSLIHI